MPKTLYVLPHEHYRPLLDAILPARLGTTIAYVPRTRPGPSSPLRRIADAEEQPLVGPEGDPDGWALMECLETTGTLFDNRGVEVTCFVRD